MYKVSNLQLSIGSWARKNKRNLTDLLGPGRVAALRAIAVSMPCLSSLINQIRAVASWLLVHSLGSAPTLGPVLSDNPDAHLA